jgi:hypothetical protein
VINHSSFVKANEFKLIKILYFITPTFYLSEFLIWISFPQSYFLNDVLGGLWTIGQIGILFTLYQLFNKKFYNGKNLKPLGISITAIGSLCYILNYVLGYSLNLNTKVLLPMGALMTGIGMTITGVEVLTSKSWIDIYRYAPLIVGLYPFLVMFPLVIVTGHPDLTAIMCWGIPWLLLSIGIVRNPDFL